mmetsp:Transcript_41667/g.118027  ORF Transcript_41667/g.118027 Transcript_41667/m.118027 type:complete len:356 (-) Transcript_41667:275-1342(-)
MHRVPLILVQVDLKLCAPAEEAQHQAGGGVRELRLAEESLRQQVARRVAQQHLPQGVADGGAEAAHVLRVVRDRGFGHVPGDVCPVGEEVPPDVLQVAHVLPGEAERLLGVGVDALADDLARVLDEALDLHAELQRRGHRGHAALRAQHRREHAHWAGRGPASAAATHHAHGGQLQPAAAIVEEGQLRVLGLHRRPRLRPGVSWRRRRRRRLRRILCAKLLEEHVLQLLRLGAGHALLRGDPVHHGLDGGRAVLPARPRARGRGAKARHARHRHAGHAAKHGRAAVAALLARHGGLLHDEAQLADDLPGLATDLRGVVGDARALPGLQRLLVQERHDHRTDEFAGLGLQPRLVRS